MRHSVDGRKFGRNTSNRVAMFRNMANSVILEEQVTTTVQKAKEVRRVVDRLITLGKTDSLHSRRLAFSRTRDQEVVKKLFSALADRYKTRAGGYTRVLKLADRRWGDAAEMAVLELVDRPELDRKRKAKTPAAAGEQKEQGQAADPLSRFRKVFGGKGAKAKTAAGKPAKTARSSAGRKTPSAGGGGSKSGGSSS